MIELSLADNFIKNFERLHSLKVYKIPLELFNGKRVLLLMCKCSGVWIDLPYCSQGYVQTDLSSFNAKAPFMFVESQDGNLFCTKKIRWQLRDTRAYSNHIYADKLNFRINLKADQPISNSNTRRKINKAKSAGIHIKSGGAELLKDFYKVYSKRMYELGSPVCGKKIIKQSLKQDDYRLFVAYLNKKPIGAATFCIQSDKDCENVLFATDMQYKHLYTSYLLHDAMISYAKKLDLESYWLGRSTRGSSVHIFKKHFHPEEENLYWSNSHNVKNIRDNKLLKKIWRQLPLPIANLLGPFANRFVY